MANQLITNQMIADESIRLFHNQNAFVMNVRRQYDDEFARVGSKVGSTIRIRLPVDYVLRNGPTAVVQDTTEPTTTLTIGSQFGVDMSFSSVDRTMVIDKFSDRYIKPAVNVTVGGIAVALMSGAEGGASGWAANYDNAGNLLAPIATTWLTAKAVLAKAGIPTDDRKIILDPTTEANTVGALSGLFNSQPLIAKQYESGSMFRALGFDWMADNTVIGHTTGTLASSGIVYTNGLGFSFNTVAGAAQVGSALTVAAMTGTLNQGDIIVTQGVYGVNRITKQTTGALRHFTVTAPVAIGATSIPIYPAIVGAIGGVAQPQQTVTVSPANGAVIYSKAMANSMYRKNLAMHPDAVTLAMVDLIEPPNVECSRRTQDDTAVRVLTQYLGQTDQLLTRLDMLAGFAYLKPEWIVIVPDPII